MYDAASRSDLTAAHQRAHGTLRIAWKRREERTVLDALRQEGSLKARFPRPEPGAWAGAVALNSSGGVASGDVLGVTARAGAGTQATIATQAAERIYRAPAGGGPAVIRNRVEVGEGAAMEWLPQETILFDRCALDRRLHVSLAADAWFLGVEALVFGRAAMGETVGRLLLRDLLHVERDGRLLLHDAVRIEGETGPLLGHAAAMRGARGLATVLHVAPDAATRLDAVRAVLADDAGASAWDGMLVARILAADGAALRAAVTGCLRALRGSRPLPRVWLC